MEAVKITRASWLGVIGPKLNAYVKKVPHKGITYESLYTWIAKVIQFGGNNSEFWVVFRDKERTEPLAFGRWNVCDLPHLGKVYADTFYSWARNKRAVDLLINEFIEFGKRHRATFYEADFTDEKVYEYFNKIVKKKGAELERINRVNAVGRLN